MLLRNGWYTENYAAGIPGALAHGAVAGSAGNGRIASAARADYAEAAAIVLSNAEFESGRTYELAGDESYTLAEFAQELSAQSKKKIAYADMPETEFKGMLLGGGLSAPIAELLADSDKCASEGALFDGSRELSSLPGRVRCPGKQRSPRRSRSLTAPALLDAVRPANSRCKSICY